MGISVVHVGRRGGVRERHMRTWPVKAEEELATSVRIMNADE
ncbi:hypothetical protein [Alloscardovia macacae]|nr:hypothetical protein [Alloscardovia macacae]